MMLIIMFNQEKSILKQGQKTSVKGRQSHWFCHAFIGRECSSRANERLGKKKIYDSTYRHLHLKISLRIMHCILGIMRINSKAALLYDTYNICVFINNNLYSPRWIELKFKHIFFSFELKLELIKIIKYVQ